MTSAPAELKTAVLYARVSTDEQFTANQIEYGAEWAARNDYRIRAVYADEGISGTVPFDERPQARRLLAELRAAPADAVLVYKLDRLGRDPADTLVAIKLIERAGARLVSMTEPIDNSSAGRLMTTIIAGLGGFERDNTLERSSTAMAQLARKPNYYPGGIVPYGYRVEGQGREAVLVIDERSIPGVGISPAEVVRLIYRWLANENRQPRWVAEELTRRGIPPRYVLDGRAVRNKRTAGIWRADRIRNLVKNSVYKGIAVYGKRRGGKSPYPVPYTEREAPAIVDADTWERAQQALAHRYRPPRKGAQRQYLFRGLIRCGVCGRLYMGQSYRLRTTGEERDYYACNGKLSARRLQGERFTRCPSATLTHEQAEMIWAEIDAWLEDPGPVIEELAAMLNADSGERQDLAAEAAQLRRELERKDDERARLLTAYRRGIIDDDELESELNKIRAEAEQLAQALEGLERMGERLAARRRQLTSARQLLEELRERKRAGLTFEVKRQVVVALIEQIVVDPDGVPHVYYRFTQSSHCRDTGS